MRGWAGGVAEYVLDTHACIFALGATGRLEARARRALEHADLRGETVWIPAVVVAEVVMLKERGHTELGLPALREAFETTIWRFLPLDLDQVDEFVALGGVRDPFDRFVVAAARRTGAKLISRNGWLAESGLVDTIWS